jgi:Sulfatase
MGDDIGWSNIGAYNQGIMAGRTPNLDRMANEGMRFTDYYAEASCTAGRANFITGELPIRTGLTTVGQAGATTGMPAQAPTIATVLKSMGYATGQFGKNHVGDRNEFLPTVHGFDEYWGYLYHLDAMEDPFHRNYPQSLLNTYRCQYPARGSNRRRCGLQVVVLWRVCPPHLSHLHSVLEREPRLKGLALILLSPKRNQRRSARLPALHASFGLTCRNLQRKNQVA